MIIKSMSRGKPSFSQLVAYMEKSGKDSEYSIYNHFHHAKAEGITKTFENNSKFLKKRKNGVYLYHEIISLTRPRHLNHQELKTKLREIALKYVAERAKNNLVYGVIHDEGKEHIHYHLMISSNEKGSEQKTRLSKQKFNAIKKTLEKQVLEKYPELEQKVAINKKSGKKLSNKGAELKRRTGKSPKKEETINKLKNIFTHSKEKETFFELLQKNNLEIYTRGKTIGFLDKENNRKHRLKTLGLEEEFRSMSDKISLENNPKEREKSKEKSHNFKKETKKEAKPKEAESVKNRENAELKLDKKERKALNELREQRELRKDRMKEKNKGKTQT